MNINVRREGPCYVRRLYVEVPLDEGYTEDEVSFIQKQLVNANYSAIRRILETVQQRREDVEARASQAP
jgi:hypothetical protein